MVACSNHAEDAIFHNMTRYQKILVSGLIQDYISDLNGQINEYKKVSRRKSTDPKNKKNLAESIRFCQKHIKIAKTIKI